MLAEVRSGRFLPDCSRSGRFVKEGDFGVPGDTKVKGPSGDPKKSPPESSSAALMKAEQVMCAQNLLTSLMSLSRGVLGEGLCRSCLWGLHTTAMGLLQ